MGGTSSAGEHFTHENRQDMKDGSLRKDFTFRIDYLLGRLPFHNYHNGCDLAT
jgi:hypothetical protein